MDALDPQKLLNDARLVDLRAKAKTLHDTREYSDILDSARHQYVDFVMEGGGMLGIGLVGYSWLLEEAGFRFLGLGGTSAGSINALLLAALDTRENSKGNKLLELFAKQDFSAFVDGDGDCKDLIWAAIDGAGPVKLSWKAVQVIDTLRDDHGLNPGTVFEAWLVELLAVADIQTLADLQARQNVLPEGLRQRDGKPIASASEIGIELAIIAADISTKTKVTFPRMAGMYWADPDEVNPARFARASMSVPIFFEPMRVKSLPRTPVAHDLWVQHAGWDWNDEGGMPPAQAVFVDGGVLSNFPIDAFHIPNKVPLAPTFGVKLEYDQRKQKVDGPLRLLMGSFNAARACLDYDFVRRNPDYRKLVAWIPAEKYNWLDFRMPAKQRYELFVEGAATAVRFLETFDWAAYKKIREGLIQGFQASAAGV